MPRSTGIAVARLCATHMSLPAYVRRFDVEMFGHRIVMAARPRVSMVGLAYYQGLKGFEPDTVRVIASLARSASVFVDVGANAGLFSILVSRIRPQARILAFEPQPLAAMSLARSIIFSGASNIEVFPIALSSQEGFLPLFTTASDTLTSLDSHRVPDAWKLTVPVSTLDVLARSQALPALDVLKVDVEGWEIEVLRGATDTIERYRPVIVFEVLEDAPVSELHIFFSSRGYAVFKLEGGAIVATDLTAPPGPNAENNLVAVPREKVTMLLNILS